MSRNRIASSFLRFAFRLFYNPFAFTYDFVSAVVSRGRWRAWTQAAIPRIQGTRVLEVPCGTGNLLLDLTASGYTPVAVDLSPWMLQITRRKFRNVGAIHVRPRSFRTPSAVGEGKAERDELPLLARARVQALPFPARAFDTVVMTFPPGFVYDLAALAELKRVLDTNGRLVWVDAGRLAPRDSWSRFLNAAFRAVDGSGDFEQGAVRLLAEAGFDARVEWVRDEASAVAVVTATKTTAAAKGALQ